MKQVKNESIRPYKQCLNGNTVLLRFKQCTEIKFPECFLHSGFELWNQKSDQALLIENSIDKISVKKVKRQKSLLSPEYCPALTLLFLCCRSVSKRHVFRSWPHSTSQCSGKMRDHISLACTVSVPSAQELVLPGKKTKEKGLTSLLLT